MAEALAALGHARPDPPDRPVLERGGQRLILLATFENGVPTWCGLLVGPSGVRPVGRTVPRSELARAGGLPEPSASLIDLAVAAAVSAAARFEELARELDTLESHREHPSTDDLSRLQRGLLLAHRHLARLERLLAELSGPLGTAFPGAEKAVSEVELDAGRTGDLANGLLQTVRDLAVLRTALEANRLSVAANELSRTSNAIAAVANTSNLRMLGVAYIALAIALVSVVVLIPNTAATILGMPSAAWVPGVWVDVILVVLAIAPIVVVFTRPWVRRMLASSPAYEARSAEGIADLPEVTPSEAARPSEAERLIRQRP